MTDPRAHLNPGSVLVRKQPDADAPAWDRLSVVGFAEFEGGAVEVVVRPAGEFAAAVHVDVEALAAAYEVEREGAPEKPFETDPLDVLLRRDSTLTDPTGAARVLAEECRPNEAPPSFKVEAFRRWKAEQNQTPEEGE